MSSSTSQHSSRPRSSRPAAGQLFPYAIVWTPLPLISWLVPVIGHTGVTNSRGIIYDFSDDFEVSVDNFAFGRPSKVYEFETRCMAGHGGASWDAAIRESAQYYARTRHSLFFNNCHQYIADVLNRVKYGTRSDWTQTEVWRLITLQSRYVDGWGCLRQWWPFAALCLAGALLLWLLLGSGS